MDQPESAPTIHDMRSRQVLRWVAGLAPVLVFAVGCRTNTMVGDGTSSVMALHFMSDCATSKVADIDDGRSDVRAVALALSLACYAQYERFCRALADETLYNDDQKQTFLWRRLSAPMREEAFVTFVLANRRNKRG